MNEIELPNKQLIINDELDIKKAIHVDDFIWTLWDLDQWLRSEIKYKQVEAFTPVREKLHELLNERSIDFDNFIQ